MTELRAKSAMIASAEGRSSQSIFARLAIRARAVITAPQVLALADQALVSGASFVSTVLIGRLTSPHELGVYALAGAVLIWLTNAQESLVSLPYTIRRNSDPTGAAVQAGHALMLSGLLSAVAVLAIVVIAVSIFMSGDHLDFVPVMWVLASIVPFVIYRDVARRFAFAELRNSEALALDCMIVTLQLGALGWLAWTNQLTSVTALGALGVACGAAVLMWLALVRDRIGFKRKRIWETARDSWAMGKWLFANQLLGALQSQMTLWFVALALGAAATGIYTACMSIALFANPIILGLSNMLWAKAGRAFQEGGSARLLRESIADAIQLGGIVGVFCIAILVWGDDILHLLYPAQDYASYGHVLTVLAFGQLVYGVGMPASTALVGMGRARTNFAVAAIEAALLASLVWPLVNYWGIIGAAYGILGGALLRLFIRWGALLVWMRRAGSTTITETSRKALGTLLSRIADGGKDVAPLDLDGCQGHVFVVTPDAEGRASSRADPALIVKLYRPERNVSAAEICGQYASLQRLHQALNGRRFHDWTINIPEPVLVSEAPQALVMTHVPGQKIAEYLHSGADATDCMRNVSDAIVAALVELWSSGFSHGDLTIGNILCDRRAQVLSFVDCGPKSECHAYAEARDRRSLAMHDLAHLLSHEGEALFRTIGRPRHRRLRRIFVEEVLRAVLVKEPSSAAKLTFLAELKCCARAHLAEPLPPYKVRGLWQALKRSAALRRMTSILESVAQQVAGDAILNSKQRSCWPGATANSA